MNWTACLLPSCGHKLGMHPCAVGLLLLQRKAPVSEVGGAQWWCDARQANNAYVFPAVGFAAVLTRARSISDDVFLTAAEALSEVTTLEVSCHSPAACSQPTSAC